MSGTEHEITVKKLKELLNQLQDDDILIPNQVGNLKIVKEEPFHRNFVGYIDFLKDGEHIEMF